MVLTNGQEKGLKVAVERYRNKEAYTCIAGYAGVGKSTLVSHIIDALNIAPQDVCYAAFTGKASLVLREKGCYNSMTMHRLLYYSKELPDGTFEHKPREKLEYNYKIIVVDEVSMIPADMWDLLLSHGIHVIALGDPFQLQPINGESEILSHPHVFLDEIVRQAQDSEIIRLSMDIRAGLPLTKHKGNEVSIVSNRQVNDVYYAGADQIIAAKNITRSNINWKCRKIKFGPDVPAYPIENEKVICLKNYWNILSTQGEPLINGMIGNLNNITCKNSLLFEDLFDKEMMSDFCIEENNKFLSLFMDYKLLTEGKQTVNNDNWQKFMGFPKPLLFDYAYCITCHKSQGSEFDKVLVFDEYMKGTDHARWLYTACTRAKQKLIIVSDY